MKHHYEIGPAVGQGRTMKAAREQAESFAAVMFGGSYEPYTVSYRDWCALVWRTPHGWFGRVSGPEEMALGCEPGKACYTGFSHSERDRCLQSTLHHLAQVTWHHSDGTTAPPFITDQSERESLASYFQWQLDYDQARKNGHDDSAARDIAGGM